MKKRLLILGLDGATFPVLEAYVRAHPGGPFERCLREGYVRDLLSTMPFFTAPSWTTFMTGLDPGRHGMYHWRGRFDPATGCRPVLSSEHLAEASLWWYSQHHGGRVCVTNFPMEYPAPPVVGRYICGTLAPESARGVTWPTSLIARIRDAIPNFRFEMDKGLSYLDRPVELRDHILQVGEGHDRALARFGKVESADLVVHVVTITDRMQHFFWHCFDPEHPEYAESPRGLVGNPILDAYAQAEATLGRLWESGRWQNTLLVSDHGMGRSTTSFHLDAWLAERGDVRFTGEGRVDFASSLAYSGEEPECSLYINRVGRDGVGVADADYEDYRAGLLRDLKSLRWPETGGPAFTAVYTQSELFRGPASASGPDLVMVPADGVHPRPGPSEVVFGRAARLRAGHRPSGILVGLGDDFAASPLGAGQGPLHMHDVFPIACMLLGLPIPGGLDGEIPPELLTSPHSPPTYAPDWDWREQVHGLPVPQSSGDELLPRLAELGYI